MSENQQMAGPEKGEQGPPPLHNKLTQPADSSTTQSPQMEVHHHGHVHEQKKWKEYVFQFIMLFLAVFLGFLAENVREKNVERNVEKEYIESLDVDLKSDYDIASRNENAIFEQAKQIDSLQDILFLDLENHPKKDSLTRVCYKLSASIKTFYSEFFNERTMTQLLSSGSMRLIKKQGVADSIMDYHSKIKFMEVQKQLYINSVNTCIQSMYSIYDITFLKTILVEDKFYYPDTETLAVRLLPADRSEIKRFIASLETTKIVAHTYKEFMGEMKVRAQRLHEFLTSTYHLE